MGIKNVIVEMRKSGHKLQEIADTLNIPRGTVSDVVVRFKRRGFVENKPHIGHHRLLDLVLFPPNINPIIVSNDHLTFV
jgi:DNA-binding IclR family transcriptional regulator